MPGNEDKGGQTVRAAQGKARAVLFIPEGTAVPAGIAADVEVVAVNPDVISAQVQRRT